MKNVIGELEGIYRALHGILKQAEAIRSERVAARDSGEVADKARHIIPFIREAICVLENDPLPERRRLEALFGGEWGR